MLQLSKTKFIIKSTVGKDKCSTGKITDKNKAVYFKKRKNWILARATSNLRYVNKCENLVIGKTHLFMANPPFWSPPFWSNFGTSTLFKKPSGIEKWYQLSLDLYFLSVKYLDVSGEKIA